MDLKSLGIKQINSGACVGGKDWIDCSANSSVASFNPSTGEKISEIQMGNSSIYND